MKIKRFRIIAIVLIIILIAGGGYYYLYSDTCTKPAQPNIIALEWANMNGYPPTSMVTSVKVEGNAFTREITVVFVASPTEIAKWLKESAGTKDIIPEKGSYDTLIYKIKAGGGAQFAEVKVSAQGTQVTIHTYWS